MFSGINVAIQPFALFLISYPQQTHCESYPHGTLHPATEMWPRLHTQGWMWSDLGCAKVEEIKYSKLQTLRVCIYIGNCIQINPHNLSDLHWSVNQFECKTPLSI